MIFKNALSLCLFAVLALSNISYAADDLSGTYQLKNQFRGNGECLEGNPSTSSVGGAVFMNTCQSVSSQLWTVENIGSGWYRLKTGQECLESNWADSPVYRGAAHTDSCQNVTGQMWKFVPEGNAYRLKSQFRENGECLEGNQATSTVHEGKAFMDSCQNVSGQFWVLEKMGGTPPPKKEVPKQIEIQNDDDFDNELELD
ncbi:RICIN domain-containing protein [Methylophaga sp.]|uniref:RICIN domain-containing protein n=1 Tax=Methylophaga sp. TaxID=2024840 RepID=UPI003A8F0F6E